MDIMIIIIILNIIFILYLLYFIIELYFLYFKLNKHPLLIKKIDNVLNKLCEEENIKVFHVSYEELNKDRKEKKDKIIGKYVYSKDEEHIIKIHNLIKEIEEIENKIKETESNYTSNIDLKYIYMPRIMLCNIDHYSSMCSYYSVFFHELGHHFSIKNDDDGSEEAADRWASLLIKKYLPSYFLLFFDFIYSYEKYEAKLNFKEKIKAYYEFIKYLIYERRKKENLKKS